MGFKEVIFRLYMFQFENLNSASLNFCLLCLSTKIWGASLKQLNSVKALFHYSVHFLLIVPQPIYPKTICILILIIGK